MDVRHAALRPETTWASGSVTYTDYYADYGNWEDDPVLEDSAGNDLTPSSSDHLVGHWTFADQPPPVYITGSFYDLYGAAADVLEAWAAKVALDFDFQADGASYQRSQKREALLQLAAQYRRKAMPIRGVQVRDDLDG